MVWSGLVWRTLYILAPMLKIYIYWHKCYFGHGDNDNRVNLEQVCSLNIEQSRLLQQYVTLEYPTQHVII